MTELTLSLEELYFLGKQIKADYLDYRYVSAMDDIGHRAALIEQKCRDELTGRGLIEENLWGDAEISEEALQFLRPVFFGPFESSCDIIRHGPQDVIATVIFHREGGEYRAAVIEEGSVKLRSVTPDDIDAFIYQLLPDKYEEMEAPQEDFVLPEERDRYIYLKNVYADGPAAVMQYFECGGYLWEEAGEIACT